MKKCPKWWCFFGFILQGKLATSLKFFRSFGIVQHIGKKIVSRNKLGMIQNTKLLRIELWNRKMPIPMVAML